MGLFGRKKYPGNKENTAVQPEKKGKGWHGDSAGHARAGRKGGKLSPGNFKNNPKRAAEAGRKGGSVSPGNFKNNRALAAAAGRKGGAARKKSK